jgi:hypothetical protein
MQKTRVGCVAVLLALASPMACPIAHADESSDLLKSKHLTAVGNLYVLPQEKEVVDNLRAALALKEKVKTENKTRAELENKIKQVRSAIQQWDFQARGMYEEFQKLTDVDQKNNNVA